MNEPHSPCQLGMSPFTVDPADLLIAVGDQIKFLRQKVASDAAVIANLTVALAAHQLKYGPVHIPRDLEKPDRSRVLELQDRGLLTLSIGGGTIEIVVGKGPMLTKENLYQAL